VDLEDLIHSQKNTMDLLWTAGGNLNTGRVGVAGAGTQTSGLRFWWR
jgi:hypothetical protein